MSGNGKGLRQRFGAVRPMSEGTVANLPEGPPTQLLKYLSDGIRYEPRKGEGETIARIEAASDQVVAGLFHEAEDALERLWERVRVPEMDGDSPALDDAGLVRWESDEFGRPKEDWSRVDGMDLEAAIGAVQRTILFASDEVARLEGRAYFAQEVAEDEYWEQYLGPLEYTIGERTAHARERTRDSRYYFLYTRWLHRRASERLRVLEQTKRDLEFAANRLAKWEELRDRNRGRMPRRTAGVT